jgi:hypothetical protein
MSGDCSNLRDNKGLSICRFKHQGAVFLRVRVSGLGKVGVLLEEIQFGQAFATRTVFIEESHALPVPFELGRALTSLV